MREGKVSMVRNLCKLTAIILAGLVLTACGAPSQEKIEAARSQYLELVEKHNQTAAAHEEVTEYTGEKELLTLADVIVKVQEHNLLEMKEEEIDGLIEEMKQAGASYDEHLAALLLKKQAEEAALLVEIPVSISNRTGKEISELYLGSDTEISEQRNLLTDFFSFGDGETLLGLIIYKDTDCTPWKLVIGGEGDQEEIEILVDSLDETGVEFELYCNADGEVTIRA